MFSKIDAVLYIIQLFVCETNKKSISGGQSVSGKALKLKDQDWTIAVPHAQYKNRLLTLYPVHVHIDLGI